MPGESAARNRVVRLSSRARFPRRVSSFISPSSLDKGSPAHENRRQMLATSRLELLEPLASRVDGSCLLQMLWTFHSPSTIHKTCLLSNENRLIPIWLLVFRSCSFHTKVKCEIVFVHDTRVLAKPIETCSQVNNPDYCSHLSSSN